MAMLKLVRYMTYFNPSTRHVPSAYQVPCSQPPLISNTPYSLSRRSAHRLRGNRPGRDAMPVLPVELSTGRQRAKRKRKGKRENPPAPPIEKAKGKESHRRVLSRNRLSRARARATARTECAPCLGLDRLVTAALDADLDTAMRAFNGTADDRRI